MVIYSVFITVDKSAENEWVEFMENEHITEVMNTGCFTGYEFLREISDNEPEKASYRIDYHLNNPKKMDLYINKFADKLRDDVIQKFGGKFSAERRIYEEIKSFV